MNCPNSGKPTKDCTCGYCPADECPYCYTTNCSFLIKGQCPVRMLWEIGHQKEMVAEEVDKQTLLVINANAISNN